VQFALMPFLGALNLLFFLNWLRGLRQCRHGFCSQARALALLASRAAPGFSARSQFCQRAACPAWAGSL